MRLGDASGPPLTLVPSLAGPSLPRGYRGKANVPIDTSKLHRSELSTKYDGFCVPQPPNNNVAKSKVKQCVVPTAPSSTSQGMDYVIEGNGEETIVEPIPLPIPIPVMQRIDTRLCDILCWTLPLKPSFLTKRTWMHGLLHPAPSLYCGLHSSIA